MMRTAKAWRVTLILELDHALSPEDFQELMATAGRSATMRRGSRMSESAPEMSVTTVARTVLPEEAVTHAVRAIERRLATVPHECHITRLRNYLVAA